MKKFKFKFKFNKISIIVLAVVLTLSVVGIVKATSTAANPSLGDASSFSILAKTTITNTGSSLISGDVGLDNAGSSYGAGLTTGNVTGTIYATNSAGPDAGLGNNPTLMTSARLANKTAFDNLSAAPNVACGDGTAGGNGDDGPSNIADGIDWTTLDSGPIDLSGKTLVPGIYCADSFIMTTGTALTLNGALASDVWIFRSAATLDTTDGVGANIVFASGSAASACNVWWKVVSSATIGTYTEFIGNILAQTAISMDTGATLDGRLFAYDAAVTLDSNTINGDCAAPVTPTTLTLDKIVVGGPASESDWTLTATGPTTTLTGPGAAGSTDVFGSVLAGTYVLSESVGPDYYTASPWSCTVDGGAVSGDPLILASAHAAICTITNTYHAPSSGGSSITYGCKDPTATNYNAFSSSKPELCIYEPTITIISTPVIIPKLPKTGFPPQEKWYESLLNSFLNLFR